MAVAAQERPQVAQPSFTIAGVGECPFGGEHPVWWWHNHEGVACWRCHQTWFQRGDQWISPYDPAFAPDADQGEQ